MNFHEGVLDKFLTPFPLLVAVDADVAVAEVVGVVVVLDAVAFEQSYLKLVETWWLSGYCMRL